MKQLILIALGLFLLTNCADKKAVQQTALLARIDSLENILLTDSLNISDEPASEIIKAYLKFADTYPKDSSAADFLFKAADVMRGMYRYQDAVQVLELVVTRYPKSDKAPAALFYAGFILHADTEQNMLAIPFFQRLIDEFPEHPLSNDARNLMPLLNMNEEQLLDFLRQRNPDSSGLAS
ncbi:MAG: tetratricopeptide repeat protein [Sphingobacteriaceae bacterium]|nr:tetratricopeptide repeat protein [Sphingobacteriaceae bacterium]